MKVVVAQYQMPEWPYAKAPELKVTTHDVVEVTPENRISINPEPGWRIAAVYIVADDDPGIDAHIAAITKNPGETRVTRGAAQDS